MKSEISVNTFNIKTARENAGYSTLRATRCVSSSKQNLVEQWEEGSRTPTWNQLKELARIYDINIFLLTSNEKIASNRVITDFRKENEIELELNAKKYINFLLQRQSFLEEVMKNEGMGDNKLVGSGTKYRNNPKQLARYITTKIGYQYAKQNSHISYLISLLESFNVFVMKTLSYWSIDEQSMRGMYLNSKFAPIIAINRGDAKTAQLFTLAHEIAHLFIASEGITNIDFRTLEQDRKNTDRTERFCNAVAANFLLPENIFDKRTYSAKDIEEIANDNQLSKQCVFYRLKALNLISPNLVNELEHKYSKKGIKKRKRKGSGGDHYINMKDSNGKFFNRLISSLYFENKINAAEASRALKMSIDFID